MPLPPSAIGANTNTINDIQRLQAIANNQFIYQSYQAINNAVAQGLFFVVLTTFLNCNLVNLINYFRALGYTVILPDVHYQNAGDNAPYSFYGVDYYQWLTNSYIFGQLQNPVRLRLEWLHPTPVTLEGPVDSTQTSNYTMSVNNEIVWADTTNNNITISLPPQPLEGWIESVTKISANNILYINGNGNDINGSTALVETVINNMSFTFVFHEGYGWSIF
jgi:hypothetical protein